MVTATDASFTRHLHELEVAIAANNDPSSSQKPLAPSSSVTPVSNNLSGSPSHIPRPVPLDLSPLAFNLGVRHHRDSTTAASTYPPMSPITPTTDDGNNLLVKDLYGVYNEEERFGKKRKTAGYCFGQDRDVRVIRSPMESVCGDNDSRMLDFFGSSSGNEGSGEDRDVEMMDGLVLSPSVAYEEGRDRDDLEVASIGNVRVKERDVAFLLGECDSLIRNNQREMTVMPKTEVNVIDPNTCSTISTCSTSTIPQGTRHSLTATSTSSTLESQPQCKVARPLLPSDRRHCSQNPMVKQEMTETCISKTEVQMNEAELRERSYRIFAATADQRIGGLRKKTRTYSKAIASRFCHICTRQRKGPTSHAICHNVKNGTCRKSVCEKCFIKFNWDWEAVRVPGALWLCPHCCNLCPPSAQCYNYEKAQNKKTRGMQKDATGSSR